MSGIIDQQMRDYIAAPAPPAPKVDGYIKLGVFGTAQGEDSGAKVPREEQFQLDWTIAKLKERLMMIVGTEPRWQVLHLQNGKGDVLAEMTDESKTLGAYSPEIGMVINVVDTDPDATAQSLNDLSQVPKYEISDEDYSKRDGTYRKWRQEHPEFRLPGQPGPKSGGAYEEEPEGVVAGARCQLKAADGGDSYRRGTVRFCAHTAFGSGYWVGIELDEPTGKNDGSVKGTQYFDCPPKCGVFVRPDKVAVGDYPPLDEEEL